MVQDHSAADRTLVILNAYAGEAFRLTDFVELSSVYLPLAQHFRQVVLIVPNVVPAQDDLPANFELVRVPGSLRRPLGFVWSAARAAAQAARARQATVWVQDPTICGIAGLVAARRTGAHLVIDLHNNFWSPWGRFSPVAKITGVIARAVARRADRVIAVSGWIAWHAKLHGIVVIPSPVQLDTFVPAATPDPQLQNDDDPPVVVPAALIKRKGHSILLQALALLRLRGDIPRFAFVGEGAERKALNDLALRLGLDDRIVFFGQRRHDAMPGVYAAARFVLLPSLDEGAPRAVAEAMAVRRLLVTTPASGALVRDGETGILCAPEPAALAAAIERALTLDAGQREAMLDRAEALVHSEFAQRSVIDRILAVLTP